MNKQACLDQVVAMLRPGMNVFIPGTSGESLAFFEALCRHPDKAAGVRFVGVHFPGINFGDYPGLHPQARQRAYFIQPNLREPMRQGRVDLLPLDYTGVWQDLQSLPIDLALAQVSPPDAAGRMSLGVCHDFLPAVWARAAIRVAHVNPRMPRTQSSFSIARADCDVVCEIDAPLVTQLSGDPGPELLAIGRHVAAMVRDGDTLQLGIGKMQSAVVRSLREHRQLRLHSGMVTEEILGLRESGAIQGVGSIVAGVALGDESFYRRLAEDDAFAFRSVGETHDICSIARIPNFVSINAAVEIDLFGQVNCDCLDGRLLAGVGGMPPFVTGARLAPGGRAIFCLSSTAGKGTISRIVPRLGTGSAVGAARYMLDRVVTEHGSAELAKLSLHQRAEKLIELADPPFREGLAAEWAGIAAGL
ncbi:MAG: acetyl-CoA hydrolase [Betaproteobacteria bacterium HGW-Betaproteobacteria-12]|nr:MAG: acetyl-CoA hydrolase [Betaproteobacteria bacterium HGW-Betaproteobacteria-12]